MLITLIVSASLAVQVVAGGIALRMLGRSDRRGPWLLLAVAMLFMAARRGLTLADLVFGSKAKPLDTPAELVAFTISALMLAAVQAFAGLIRERQREASALATSEARYRNLVETSHDLIWSVDEEGRWTFLNAEATRRIYGCEPQEMLGRSFVESLADDRKAIDPDTHRKILEGARVVDFETTHLRRDGRRVTLRFNAIPLRDESGKVVGTTGTATDVTAARDAERKEKELQDRLVESQRLESLGVLAGGIAHDFNNLLMAISGNAYLALDLLPTGSEVRNAVQSVIQASERATTLTRQMLTYAGKGRHQISSIDMSKVVREICPLVVPTVSKKVQLDLDLDPQIPPIDGDDGQIQQVVMNLVINAAEALADKVGSVSVRTFVRFAHDGEFTSRLGAESLPAGRYVMLEVEDTGCGMDAETQRRIFEPFFTTKFVGRGLGLSALLGIVRRHHGGLAIDSEVGVGTTFRLAFPPGATAPAPTQTPAPVADSRGNALILLVDDEDGVLRIARTALERAGHTVVTASNGRTAIEVFATVKDRVSLAILDMSMPEMDGAETLDALQRVRPGLRVILASGYHDHLDDPLRTHAGPVSFLPKPYTPGQLVGLVHDMLARAPRPDAAATSS